MAASTVSAETATRGWGRGVRLFTPRVAAWSVILLSPLPLLLVHFRRLWSYEHYQYFVFVLTAFAFLTWQRWPSGLRAVRTPMPKTVRTLLGIGFAVLAFSTFVWAPWLAAVSAILLVAAAVVEFAGRESLAGLFPVWLLLLLLLPLPFGLDIQLIFELQTLCSRAASKLLDFLSVNHLLAGHVIEVPGKKFMVEEACSGIQSLFALLAFGAMLVVWLRRTWYQSLFLLAGAVFWATSINVIRIASVVVASAWYDFDLGIPWRHETLGLVLNGFALLMLVCTDQWILFFLESPEHVLADEDRLLLGDDQDEEPEEERAADQEPAVPALAAPPRRRFIALTGFFALLVIGQLFSVFLKVDTLRVAGEASERLDGAFQESTLPVQLGPWKRVGFNADSRKISSNLGGNFATWQYEGNGMTVFVHTNYPFLGWHDLPMCFDAQGWRIETLERRIRPGEPGPIAEYWSFESGKPTEVMHVRFCQFDAAGEQLEPTRMGWPTSFRRALGHYPGSPFRFLASNASTYQVVLQVSGSIGNESISREEITTAFLQARRKILSTVLERLHRDE